MRSENRCRSSAAIRGLRPGAANVPMPENRPKHSPHHGRNIAQLARLVPHGLSICVNRYVAALGAGPLRAMLAYSGIFCVRRAFYGVMRLEQWPLRRNCTPILPV
jgi:hypothetical protein